MKNSMFKKVLKVFLGLALALNLLLFTKIIQAVDPADPEDCGYWRYWEQYNGYRCEPDPIYKVCLGLWKWKS